MLLNLSLCLSLCFQVHKDIMRVDEQELTNRYKIGVLYCKAGQTSEEEWYNNGERNDFCVATCKCTL